MGTRNLTVVKMGGKIKVAQYCQWDGYPTGVGANIAKILRKLDLPKFKAQLKKVRFLTDKEASAKFEKALGHTRDSITMDESDKLKKAVPELHRDTGPNVLPLILKGTTELQNAVGFEDAKGLFGCEWLYEIDVDKKIVTVKGYRVKRKYAFKDFTPKAMKALEDELNEKYQ
jgi:hypothetical protein